MLLGLQKRRVKILTDEVHVNLLEKRTVSCFATGRAAETRTWAMLGTRWNPVLKVTGSFSAAILPASSAIASIRETWSPVRDPRSLNVSVGRTR